MLYQVPGNRIGNDINPYLIGMFQALQKGWIPPDNITDELWHEIKKNKDNYPRELVAFCGFCCSFGARFFSTYARNLKNRNYAGTGKKNLLYMRNYIHNAVFTCLDYKTMAIPAKSLIYCDPPIVFQKKCFTQGLVLRINLIMSSFGSGLGKKQEKAIKYSLANITPQKILNVWQ
jgi:DNA adenine methylase